MIDMNEISSLCKRRGFVFQSGEIYGGLGSVFDYGPLGVELKQNIKNKWWRSMVQEREDVVGLDASILAHPQTWVASGHIQNFADPLVECKSCHLRFKANDVEGRCPECQGELTSPRMFNLMFKTFMGPVEDEASMIHLRPEIAQGIFTNFGNVLSATRKKLPLGIAQMGKSFRNEITTGNFTFRTREFEQMELEFFTRPEEESWWLNYWKEERLNWYIDLGIRRENLRLRRHQKEELAHYARDCYDIEYLFPFGWGEIEGIASRGDFDLRRHAEVSGKDLTYFDEERGEHIFPYVIEPSSGVDRIMLALLIDSYHEEKVEGEKRVVLKLKAKLAPLKVAVLPLSRREELIRLAYEVNLSLKPHFMSAYDDTQSIGRRYRRQDEIGTPFCITIDFQSLEDNQVTIRERDSLRQIRIPIEVLTTTLKAKLSSEPFDVLPPGGSHWLGFER
jgi:glycyl-tRNA synthetase